jgi:hypothetical protein
MRFHSNEMRSAPLVFFRMVSLRTATSWIFLFLDTDGDREWEEVMGLLSDTDGIDMTFNDDESVTLRWEASTEEIRPVEVSELLEEPAPF